MATLEFYFSLPRREDFKRFLIYLLFVANLAGIFFLWSVGSDYYIKNPADGNIFIAIGRLFGLLGEFFLLIQLVLVGRIRPIERLFGFDRLNKIHRTIGYSIALFILGHPLLLILGYAEAGGISFFSQLGEFLSNSEYVLLAYLALLLFIFVIFISLPFVRGRLHYDRWYFTHLLIYLAIGLVFPHQLGIADLRGGAPLYYWYILNFGVFGVFLSYRFIRPLFLFWRHRFEVAKVVKESPDTWSLYIKGKKMEKFRFESGQYANINIFAGGIWWSKHPFSFSAPYDGKMIRFSIKALGDYTSKIQNVPMGARVLIDGPLGLFVERTALRNKFLLIAGGIGITPLRSMVSDLVFKNKNTVLLYGVKTEKDFVFKREIDDLAEKSELLGVHYVLSSPEPGFESGYIDKEKIIRLVPDFYEREVFLCGPPLMMNSVVSSLKELGFPKKNIHFEKFSF